MNIQVIWENGVFRPIQPISVKHATLTIVVPDEEIETLAAVNLPVFDLNDFSVEVREELARMQAINEVAQKMTLSVESDQVESAEQEQRTRAFELRNAIRREQGRPA